VDLLIDAFCRVAENSPQIELVLVGGGPLGAALKKQVPETIRSRVHFAGFRPVAELPKFFAESDVFVLPSRHDGWGVVVNQAAAAGMPIIASDAVGAAADLVVESENGRLFPAGNGEILQEAIASFAGCTEKIQSYGLRSRKLAMAWTTEQCVNRWHNLLTVVADRKQRQTEFGATS